MGQKVKGWKSQMKVTVSMQKVVTCGMLYCMRSIMTHDVVTRSVSEGRNFCPRLRFWLLSEPTECTLAESEICEESNPQ